MNLREKVENEVPTLEDFRNLQHSNSTKAHADDMECLALKVDK